MATKRREVYNDKGQLVSSTDVVVSTEEANLDTIYTLAQQALLDNRTYLALSSPTNAQNLAQIRALTRQNQRIIRLLLNQLDGTD